MPITQIPLDSSDKEEYVTILHGKNLVLKLIENDEWKHFLLLKEVQQFLTTEDLTFSGFRNIMESIVRIEDQIEEKLEQVLQEARLQYRLKTVFSTLDYETPIVKKTKRKVRIRPEVAKMSVLASQILGKTIALQKESLRLTGRKGAASLDKEIRKLDNELLEQENKIKEFNKTLEVLEASVILRCPECKSPLFEEAKADGSEGKTRVIRGEVKHPTKCLACTTVVDRKNALRLHTHTMKKPIKQLWNENAWLEDYASRLLRSMGWQTWSHLHVVGSSGVRHEIDVLGVKESNVLIGECKSGKVSRKDVFNFWAKVYDIRSHMSLLAIIGTLPDSETRAFVVKNPAVVLLENLGEKRKSQLQNELSTSVLSRV